ncbi:MAG: hypothetical protein R2726_10165 [Acidimicrobiales bacterium]
MAVLVAVETVVLVVLAVLVVGLLRSHAVILRRLHELGAGVDRTSAGAGAGVTSQVDFTTRPEIPAPSGELEFADAADVSGVTLGGEVVALRVVGAGHDTLLAFLSSSCATCERFWAAFAAGLGDEVLLPSGTRLVVVAKSPEEESPSRLAELAPAGIDLVLSSQAWGDYRVPGSPYFVFVEGATGRVRGEGTGMDWPQVAGLLAQATGDLGFTLGDKGARHAKPMSDAEREAQIDQELMAAGIFPGDASLYEPPPTPAPGESEPPA